MKNVPTEQLRQIYRNSLNGISKSQALDLITVSAELGKRGWTLNADETDWIPPLKPVQVKKP